MKQYIFGFLLLLFACNNTTNEKDKILFLGHTYLWGSPDKVDPRIEKLVKKYHFERIWLGGDICAHTSENSATLDYLEGLFQIKKPTNHWAYGNHDIMDKGDSLLNSYRNKNSFYTFHDNGNTIIVLNTNILPQGPIKRDEINCKKMEDQYNILKNVTDTIKNSNNLLILHHYSLVTDSLTNNSFSIRDVFNLYLPDLQYSCTNFGNFESQIYPMLQNVKSRGINVILIGGDVGARSKQFQFTTKEGIVFLGSGINNSCPKEFAPEYVTTFENDKILILDTKFPKNISWNFYDLDSLTR